MTSRPRPGRLGATRGASDRSGQGERSPVAPATWCSHFSFPARVKVQRFQLLQPVGGFPNESGRKIADGAWSVNMKIHLELNQKAGTRGGGKQTEKTPRVSQLFDFCLSSQGTACAACRAVSSHLTVPTPRSTWMRPLSDPWVRSRHLLG